MDSYHQQAFKQLLNQVARQLFDRNHESLLERQRAKVREFIFLGGRMPDTWRLTNIDGY